MNNKHGIFRIALCALVATGLSVANAVTFGQEANPKAANPKAANPKAEGKQEDGGKAAKQDDEKQVDDKKADDKKVELPAAQDPKQDVPKPNNIQQVGNGKIKFTFEQTPWERVIRFFAKEAGFYLQPEAVMPEGSFRYSDTKEFTVMEGLDLLNRALALREYTLLRNEKMLYLIRVDQLRDQKFRDFVEWVKPEDLGKRGLYEIMQVEFDLGDLNVDEIRRDVEPYIGDSHRRSFKLALGAKKMIVRENGGSLRKIKALIDSAQLRLDATKNKLTVHKLEHGTVEDVMPILRVMERLDENNQAADITVFVDSLTNTLYIRGTKSRVEGLINSAKQIDKQMISSNDGKLEQPFLKIHKVVGDAESVFKVVVTMIQNTGLTGVIIDRMPTTGQIIVSATQENHDQVEKWIKQFQTPAVVVESIDLDYLSTSSVLADLETMFPSGDGTDGEEGMDSGLKYIEDSENDRIIVRGPPLLVEAVMEVVAKLDVPLRIRKTNRQPYRVLRMSDKKAESAMRAIQDLFEATGKKNKIEMVMPDRRDNQNRFMIPPSRNNNDDNRSNDNRSNGNNEGVLPKNGNQNDGVNNRRGTLPKKLGDARNSMGLEEQAVFCSVHTFPEQDQEDQDSVSDRRQENPRTDDEKQEPELKSVPGAPIKIKMTEVGLVIASEDLDALDDLELLIREHFDTDEVGEAETKFFLLEHRDPQKALVQLENLILGPDSGGGGGGGGGGNPLANIAGNAMQNALGMNPLDLLGGGGSDAGTGILPMVSDVVLHADTRLKGLWVKAVEEDLELIAEVIDIIDREQPYHMVNPLGKTRRIAVNHRDPSEVEQLIRNQMGMLFEQAGGQGGGQNPQQLQQQMQQQMMRQMQQLMGGGNRRRGSGGGNQVEDETPKATLGVDPQGRALLVTGPEFIADLVEDLVTIIDIKQVEPETYMAVIELKGQVDPAVVGRAIQGMLGEKAQSNMEGGGGGTTTNPATRTPTRGGTGTQQAQRAQQMQQEAMRAAMMRAFQQRAGGQRGGGNTRGGGTRGGGTRGGGNTRGRGGR